MQYSYNNFLKWVIFFQILKILKIVIYDIINMDIYQKNNILNM